MKEKEQVTITESTYEAFRFNRDEIKLLKSLIDEKIELLEKIKREEMISFIPKSVGNMIVSEFLPKFNKLKEIFK